MGGERGRARREDDDSTRKGRCRIQESFLGRAMPETPGDGRTRGLAAPDGAERGDRRKPSVNKSESEETAKGNDGVEVAGRFHRRGQFAGVDERRADRRAGPVFNTIK